MDVTEQMRALKKQGMSFRRIGDQFNMSGTAVFYKLGGKKKPSAKQVINEDPAASFLIDGEAIQGPVSKFAMGRARKLVAANDNHPDRFVKMVPVNGGCSTTSGMMPVTLARSAGDEQVAA